jgi:hypothetical protein
MSISFANGLVITIVFLLLFQAWARTSNEATSITIHDGNTSTTVCPHNRNPRTIVILIVFCIALVARVM